MTTQRVIILAYVNGNYNHPSVEDVFNFVKNKLPRISKKTIYINLQFLSKKGLINEVKVKGVQRYEPQLDPHHHMICTKCDKIADIESEELLLHAKQIGENIQDFYMESCSVNFYGLCEKCKRGK